MNENGSETMKKITGENCDVECWLFSRKKNTSSIEFRWLERLGGGLILNCLKWFNSGRYSFIHMAWVDVL